MSDSEKELFGDNDDREVSDVESVDERQPFRKSVDLKRFPGSHNIDKAWVSRVPAFLNLDPQPFDAEKFRETEKTGDELTMEANTIRWKYAANEEGSDEKVTRISNARIVEWSDGSRTLQLGNEHFEIKSHAQNEPAFICSEHEEEGLLATRELVDETMSFVPISTSSATHLMMARALARKQENSQIRVGSVNTTEDPDKVQREIERTEQAKDKARRKLSAQREDIISYSGRAAYAANDESMDEEQADSSSDMDDDLDKHASRLTQIKQQNYDEDEDEDEDEEEKEGSQSDDEQAANVSRRRVLDDDSD